MNSRFFDRVRSAFYFKEGDRSMNHFAKICRKITLAAGYLSGFCVCAATVLILSEIVIRSTTSYTLYVSDEYTGYLMALSSMLGLAYVEREHGHIRMDLIDLLQERSPRILRFLKYVAYCSAIVVAVMLCIVSYNLFAKSFANGSRSMQISATRLWIPQIFLVVGSVLLTIQYCCNFYLFAAGSSEK